MPNIKVTRTGVEKMLKDLDPNKASGPDKISPLILKQLATPISQHLQIIFQTSINSGTAPKQWRLATVSPIFKKGDRHLASNYRPVSLTAVACKLCEHIIAKSIMCHLEAHNLLTDYQHGFRAKRSCETQLLCFIDDLAQNMCDGHQVDIAVMDFSKAFDVVPHERLLSKLDFYGIRGHPHSWIRSFLSERSQQVVVDGKMSQPAPVISGVPQGSVLGPILFLLFINDMPDCVQSRCRLFADDSIIYRNVQNLTDCQDLQNDLKSLESWETDWGMRFNPSKCNIISVTRKRNPLKFAYKLKGHELERVPHATYLGIDISSDLSWHQQTHKATSKANRNLGFIKRNLKTKNQTVKQLAYQAIVRPTLEYASTIWSPHQKELINKIEMVQRRAARYVTGNYQHQASVTTMLEQLGWQTLESRRQQARIILGYKILNGLVAVPANQLIPAPVTTRGHSLRFTQISARTNYYKFTFFPQFIVLWNSLPQQVVDSNTLALFKSQLHQSLNTQTN